MTTVNQNTMQLIDQVDSRAQLCTNKRDSTETV